MQTPLQFGTEGSDSIASNAAAKSPRAARVCPICSQRFSSSDARFCPFDGEPLEDGQRFSRSADPLVSLVIDDRYEILELIGEGGMGSVYRTRHVRLDRPFALKALKRELSVDEELSARFIREAKAAAAISHPNVVQISDFGTLPTRQPYFVMELLEGSSLSSLIWNAGPLPPIRALRIAREIAQGLAAAHAVGVIHRDLKPDNVHVGTRDDSPVKVLDFGLAKVAGGSKLTRQGIVYGTPHYMSPEQASGELVDARSDLYALGVVLYEMLTGRVPFEADSYMGVLTKQLYAAPSPPGDVMAELGSLGVLDKVVMRCLEKRPSKRFESMSALIREFDRLSLELRTERATVAATPRSPRKSGADLRRLSSSSHIPLGAPAPPRWRRPALAVGGGLVLALGLGLYWWSAKADAGADSVAPSTANVPPATPAEAARAGSAAAPVSTTEHAPQAPPVKAPPRLTAEPHSEPPPAEHANLRTPTPTAERRPPRSAPPKPPAEDKSEKRPAIGGGEIVDPWAK